MSKPGGTAFHVKGHLVATIESVELLRLVISDSDYNISTNNARLKGTASLPKKYVHQKVIMVYAIKH